MHHDKTPILPKNRTPKKGGLGNNGRYVDQRHATGLVRTYDPKASLQMYHCKWSAFDPLVTLAKSSKTGLSSYKGLMTCSKVWLCPLCSARISWMRANEVNALLSWARKKGYGIQMLTLTTRHGLGDDLAGQLEAMKQAKRRFQQRREWRALKQEIVGSVTATEESHGGNGWHTHFHIVVITKIPVDLAALLPVWLTCLAAFGLSGNKHALQVQDASAVKEYLTKFGAAEELTLGHSKQGREGGRSPWQLLRDSRGGDQRATALWIEYAKAFKGRRQLVWSNGLKKLAGVKEQTDDQAAKDAENETFEALREWDVWAWSNSRSRRGSMIDAANVDHETEGARMLAIAKAEVGPSDRQNDRAEKFDVLE